MVSLCVKLKNYQIKTKKLKRNYLFKENYS